MRKVINRDIILDILIPQIVENFMSALILLLDLMDVVLEPFLMWKHYNVMNPKMCKDGKREELICC